MGVAAGREMDPETGDDAQGFQGPTAGVRAPGAERRAVVGADRAVKRGTG